MARKTTALNDQEIKKAKGKEKTYKLFDGLGLYLQITPSGSKAWRFRYRFNNKERTMSFGSYPEVTLAKAREKRDANRTKIADGIDPLKEKADIEEKQRFDDARKLNTWKILLDQYLHWKDLSGEMNATTFKKLQKRFEAETSHFGGLPFADVTDDQVREVLLKMSKRGAVESARRFHTQLIHFYQWARENKHLVKGVPTIPEMISKKHLLPKGKIKKANYPIITDKKLLGELLRDIDQAPCEYASRQMLKVFPHLAVRPKNLREMRWNEINWEEKLWIIPKEKMKAGITHVVPLTDYVLGVLAETRDQYSSGRDLVFPSYRTGKVLSEATPNTCLKRIGIDPKTKKGKWESKVVTHSFRGIFSTFANQAMDEKKELLWESKIIEAVLAHSLSGEVEKAYNRADYLDQRRELMQWWTSYLLEVKNAI